jgi:hypothetical protein
MHLPPLYSPASSLQPVPLAPGSHRARIALQAVFAEVAPYVCGSQWSCLRGRAAVRELDARLRRDVGVVGATPDGRLFGLEGLC